MHIINVTVRDKIASYVGDAYYVCGNSDFVVRFDFDDEWAALEVKTARFICEDGSFRNQVFNGNECPVPIISNTNNIRVGVFAGNLCTTTPARVPAVKSILCPGGMPAAPEDDTYNKIMQEVADAAHTASETAKTLQEAFGESGLYLVVARDDADAAIRYYTDKAPEEIKAAVAAGKTCLLVMNGNVYLYNGVANHPMYPSQYPKCPTFARVSKYVHGEGIVHDIGYVQPDRRFEVFSSGASKTPNPYKLTLTGAVDAAYDGSAAVNVNIPKAKQFEQVLTVTPGASALEVLEADANGAAFNFTDCIVEIETGGGSGTSPLPVTVLFYSGAEKLAQCTINNAIDKLSKRYSMAELRNDCGVYRATSYGPAVAPHGNCEVSSAPVAPIASGNVTRISVSVSGGVFPDGSTITVKAVRAAT